MKHVFSRMAILLIMAAVLVGCGETTPKDIQSWQASGNTSKLIATLSDGRQFMRLDAINALGELKATDAVEPLAALIKDPDVVVAHAAIDALAAIGTPSIESPMLLALELETLPARLTAARALGALKAKAATEPLSDLLNSEHRELVLAAITALGQIGDPSAIKSLAESAESNTASVREASLVALVEIGGDATLEPLAVALGDVSEIVRAVAIAALIERGEDAKPAALAALRSEDALQRSSGMAVLKGVNAAPTAGEDRVWYALAELTCARGDEIDRAAASELAEIEGGHDALIDAVAHGDETTREYAFAALETIGEPIAATVAARAATQATPEAITWFEGRSNWAGAPNWRLDLWAGATALNPRFDLHKSGMKALRDKPSQALVMMNNPKFKAYRELVPILIAQFGVIEPAGASPCAFRLASPEEADKRESSTKKAARRARATKRLEEAGDAAVFPLIAALDDEDLAVAARSASILLDIGADDASELILAAYASRLDAGEDLAGSSLFDVTQELALPGAEELLKKTRPNERRALAVFAQKHPEVPVTSVPLPPREPLPTLEPFKLKYVKNGKAKEFKVVFKLRDNGDWTPEPPLPDALP